MPIEAVKIPQNVYIEDRIVGPLTLKQTIIMMLGGGFSYVLYAAIQKTYGSVSIPVTVLAWIPFGIAALFALVRVNDLSLMRICLLLVERANKPTMRTWAPRSGISVTLRTTSATAGESHVSERAPSPASTQEQIARLSSVVDQTLPIATDQPAPTEDSQTNNQQLKTSNPAGSEQVMTATHAEEQLPPLPVNRNKIKADESPALSDLAVFRDIFTNSPRAQ